MPPEFMAVFQGLLTFSPVTNFIQLLPLNISSEFLSINDPTLFGILGLA
jgi:hypothetical protein